MVSCWLETLVLSSKKLTEETYLRCLQLSTGSWRLLAENSSAEATNQQFQILKDCLCKILPQLIEGVRRL